MGTFSTTLAPVLSLIFLGYALKRIGFLADNAWAGIEKLTYYILLPSLLVRSLANQNLEGAPWFTMLLVILGGLIGATIVLLVLKKLQPGLPGTVFTSVFQGGIRFNTYISLAVSQGLFGSRGLELGSITSGFMIVFINLACVAVFIVWGKARFKGWGSLANEIVVNPLVVSCVIGWFLAFTGIGLPGVTADVFEIVGRAALPFGLIAVGSALKPVAMRGHIRPVVLSTIVQFCVKPFIIAALAVMLGIDGGIAAGVIIIAFMVPTAPSSYILARQLGGDVDSMVSIITFQTIFAFIAMPVVAFLLL